MMRQVGSILSVLLVCCAFCSCSGQLGQVAPQQIPDREDARPPGTDTGQSQGLPAIAELDELTKETGAISSLNVLNPLLQRATTPQDGSLLLDSTAGELSYAIYAAHGIPGIPHFVKCEGQGSLWLMAADYSRQRWETASFDDDLAAIDLRQLGSPYSEEDLSYIALVCPRGSHALANKLS